jgi:hypothetical protein
VSVVVAFRDEATKRTLSARITLTASQLEPFGNTALVAAAQQAAMSLLRPAVYDGWAAQLAPAIRRHLVDHPKNQASL